MDLDMARSLAQIGVAAEAGRLTDCYVPPFQALAGLSEVVLDPAGLERFVHGSPVGLGPGAVDEVSDAVCAVYDGDRELCGIGRLEADRSSLQPLQVFRAASPS